MYLCRNISFLEVPKWLRSTDATLVIKLTTLMISVIKFSGHGNISSPSIETTYSEWLYAIYIIFIIFRYHLPRSWLQPTRNLLVVFEELGGDVTKVNLKKRSVSTICSDVSEWHPTVRNWKVEDDSDARQIVYKPKVHLKCAPGQSISAIKFASFGTPLGACGNFRQGACHSSNSHTILEKVP